MGPDAHPGEAYEIDRDSLRARPVDPVAMRARATELAAQSRDEPDPVRAARTASSAAMLWIVLDELTTAHALFDFALARLPSGTQAAARTVTEIRLAQWHQAAGDLVTARHQLEAVVARCRAADELQRWLHFALQHLGKVLFELGEHGDALERLREAHALRVAQHASAGLLVSSELAIDAVQRAMKGGER